MIKNSGYEEILFSLLPSLYRIHRSCVGQRAVPKYIPSVSSRISHVLDIHQDMHHLKYIFLDRRQMLSLSSTLQLVLLLIHLAREQCKFLHTVHSQYIFVHQHLVVWQLAFINSLKVHTFETI